MRHEELVAQALKNPEVQAAYDALEPEFSLLADMIKARKAVGLSQAQVAAHMGIQVPAVTRLEGALSGSSHSSPSIATLKKYARAVGCKLEMRMYPLD